MSTELQKASTFISRLLHNPSLGQYTPLQKEEQIIQFLHVNAGQLSPTLSSPSFFPGKSWNEVFGILVRALFQAVNDELFPQIRQILESRIDFGFVSFLDERHADESQIREQVYNAVTGILTKPEARRTFTGAHAAIHFDVCDRYIEEMFARKSYAHFELTKVQRLRMGKPEVRHLVETTLMLKPVIYLLSAGGGATGGEEVSGVVQNQFAEKVLAALRKQLTALPESVLSSAVNSSMSFTENRFVEATARIAAIFAARSKSYQPDVRVDRGADTPDKSWFNIARRNYKFYGFDVKMLDEFYKTAAENGW